jgi:predicted chitinase
MLTGAHITAALKSVGAGTGLVMPADDIAKLFSDAILKYGAGKFNTTAKVAALLSQCMMESAYFRTTEEYAKNGPYAPFIGRTFMQVTHKSNYQDFGTWCFQKGLVPNASYFVDDPKRLAANKWAALGGVWYFTQVQFSGKSLTEYAANVDQVSKAVNLGNPFSSALPNGYKDRRTAYSTFLDLGSTIIPKETINVATERIPFRGGLTCACVVESLPWVELDMILHGIIKSEIDIFQLGYRPGGTAASAGTHDRGGCVDVGQYSADAIRIWRKWGWAMQDRSPFFAEDHGHGWPYGCDHLAYAAKLQENDWDRKDNGLVGNGRIQGPYPIRTWTEALKENKMAVLDEVVSAVLKALAKDETVNIAESELTGNPKNKGVAVTTALDYIGRRVQAIRNDGATKADVMRIEKKVDALAASIAKLK